MPMSDKDFVHYLDWRHIAFAVLEVAKENQREWEKNNSCIKADADIWVSNERLRQDIHHRACAFWCKRTNLDHTWFPYSVDGVARLYFRFRKRNEDEVSDFRHRFDRGNDGPSQLPFSES